jgi:hypothetical protein
MTTPSIYCDGIEEISFANGVLRLHLTQLRGNTSVPAGTVLLPIGIARSLAENLIGAAQQIEQQFVQPAPAAPPATQAGADFLASIPKLT